MFSLEAGRTLAQQLRELAAGRKGGQQQSRLARPQGPQAAGTLLNGRVAAARQGSGLPQDSRNRPGFPGRQGILKNSNISRVFAGLGRVNRRHTLKPLLVWGVIHQ
jgi:hypothetical protein